MEALDQTMDSFEFLSSDSCAQEEFLNHLNSGHQNARRTVQLQPVENIEIAQQPAELMFNYEHSRSCDIDEYSELIEDNSSNNGNCDDQMLPQENCKTRGWKLVHLNSLLLTNQHSRGNPIATQDWGHFTERIRVELCTRGDCSNSSVPERLYSSLKYVMKHSVQQDLLMESTTLLMCKVEIVDPHNPRIEILKADGQKLIKGIQDVTAMGHNPSNSAGRLLECKMKIQFTDVSYHHENKCFAFKISFIDPLVHISEPVIVLLSAPFQVFARRPTMRARKELHKKKNKQPNKDTQSTSVLEQKSATSSLKRKEMLSFDRSLVQQQSLPPPQPKKKIKGPFPQHVAKPILPRAEKVNLAISANLNDFLRCLDLLVAFKNSLTSEEQKEALEAAQQRLFTLPSATLSHRSSTFQGSAQQLETAEQDCIDSFFSEL